MIDWVKLENQDPWQAMNVTDINISGLETGISLNIQEVSGNTSFVKNVTVGYSYLKANKSSNEFMSRYVLDILRHKAELLINHTIFKNFSASWAFTFQDRVGGYIKYTNGVSDTKETPYDPFLQLDLQLNYRVKNWLLFAEATNLFNQTYVDYGNVPQPGIWFRTGVRFNASLKNIGKQP
jgi:iron complex outermembrane receptor protein